MAILLIDPRDGRRAATQRYLLRAGYSIETALNAAEARERMAGRPYEFVLLAQRLPDADGLALLRECVWRGNRTSAFILLTGSEDVEDRLQGFAAGADDCLAASVSLVELEQRLRIIARQRFGRPRPRIRFGAGFELDLAGRLLRHGAHAVDLSRSQFDLLHHLLRHRGQVLTRQQLGAHIGRVDEGSNFIDVHIKNVRKVLAQFAPPDFLRTVRGIGYQAA
ncbi:response regulator transcription factor [Hymenobacter daeguensis]